MFITDYFMYLLERVNIYLFYANQIPKLIISPYVVQSVFPEAMFEITRNQTSWLKKKTLYVTINKTVKILYA